MTRLFSTTFFLLTITLTYGQFLSITPDTIICKGQNIELKATFPIPVFNTIGGTGPYQVNQITYSPEIIDSSAVELIDSSYNDNNFYGPYPLPFDFCFFGGSWTEYYIASNGWLSFSPINTTFYDPWLTVQIPNVSNSPKNAILGIWRDMNISLGGNISYMIKGNAPSRRLILTWNELPMYSCTNQTITTQIVLYETTNIIDVHLINTPACASWNDGNGVLGIQNITGTIGITAPGMNNTNFSVVGESWRFTPNGTQITELIWKDQFGTLYGSDTIILFGTTLDSVLMQAQLIACNQVITEEVMIYTHPVPEFDLNTSSVNCYGQNDGMALTTVIDPVYPVNYEWSNGDTLSGTFLNSMQIVSLSPGSYQLEISDACQITIDTLFWITEPDSLLLTLKELYNYKVNNSSITLFADVTGGTPPYSYEWSNGDTTVFIVPDTTGTYQVTVTDVNGCEISDEIYTLLNIENSNNPKLDLHVYPNPVSDVLYISCESGRISQIQIYSSVGTCIEEYSVNPGETIHILMNKLPGGIYLLKAKSEKQVYIKKIVKE